jgi:TRAP-type transport system periplasmic protein
MMNRRRFLKIAAKTAAAVGMIGVAGTGGVAFAQNARRMRVANFYATEHSMNRALREVFVPRLEDLSGDTLTASIHDNSSLGAEGELTEGLRLGTIEMGITGGLLSASRPRLAVLELPFVFRDFDHAWAVFDSDIGDDLATEFEAEGIKLLAWVGNGFRAISNSVRPLNSLADMAGLRLRMPENRVYIETGRALGFNVVTMPFSEIFNALSQRVVDAQDNPPPTVLASRWFEVQDHLAITNHIFSYGGISVNKRLYDGLPVEQQQALQDAADEFATAQRRMLEDDSAAVITQLEAEGMQITRPDITELQAATENVRAEIAADVPGGVELLARIAAL